MPNRVPIENQKILAKSAFPSKRVWELICRGFSTTSSSEIGGWGCTTGKSFRFARSCVRAVWLPSGFASQKRMLPFSLYGPPSFPFWGRRIPLPHVPQTSYPFLVGLIGIFDIAVRSFFDAAASHVILCVPVIFHWCFLYVPQWPWGRSS